MISLLYRKGRSASCITRNTQRRHLSSQNLEKKRLYLRQAVRLTGLSTEVFDKAVLVCKEVLTDMKIHFPDNSMSKWQTATYEGHVALDIHTRYFTPRKTAPNEQNLPFADGVDPHGVLAGLRKHDLIHGLDNKVSYLELLEHER